MYYVVLIRSSVDGHLGGLHVLAIVNSAAVHLGLGACIFLIYSFVCVYTQEWDC